MCTELSLLAIRLPFGGGAEEDVFPGEGLVLREVLPVLTCHVYVTETFLPKLAYYLIYMLQR